LEIKVLVIQIKLVALFLSSYSSFFAILHIVYQTVMLDDWRCISVKSFLLLGNVGGALHNRLKNACNV